MQRCLGCMREFSKNYNICPFCGYVVGTESDIKNHLLPGTQLANRYILGKAIGHGGFGITYIARDSKIQKTVAIKEYFPNAFSTRSAGETRLSCYNSEAESFLKEGIKKMLDEAKRMSKFSNNENVVDIYDFFEENNTAYIVMEYLEGKDLKKYLEETGGKLKPEKAVEIMLPVLNALEDMHKENLIHRDISPDNIFICNNGKIKVLDFGSARLAVEERDKSYSVMVKRGYAPKEQYTSRSKQGPWTDVYAVCATLYKMITGSLPVESTERDGTHLKSFSEFGIKDYNRLESVIFKGLEVEYTNRTQTIPELKNNLLRSVGYGQATAEVPTKNKKKKNSVIAIFVALTVFMLTSIMVAAVILAINFIPREKSDESQETTVSTQQASENLTAQAMKEYEEHLAEYKNFTSAYVVDINKDGICEVICSPENVNLHFIMTYSEKSGLSVVNIEGSSSWLPEIYISEENCIYMRDDGHNRGTSFYHHASVYEIDETGFVKLGEVEGDDPEAFDWQNEALFNEMDKKYEDLFEQKIYQLTGEKTFKAYSEVANSYNPVEYLNSELSINIRQTIDHRQIYEDYLNSNQAQEYYESKSFYDMYDDNKYNGKKDLLFIDIDADGTEECLLSVPFTSESSLSYEIAYVFDIDGETVRLVYSTLDCGSHRAQQKLSLLKNNGAYLIHNFYRDPHALWGSVYSYDGKNINLVWSYDCDVTQGIPEEEHIFLVSQENDFFNTSPLNETYGISDYLEGVDLPEHISSVSADEFYEIYNKYSDAAEYRVPLHKTSYRVTNPAGAIVRASADADSKEIGRLHSGENVTAHNAFQKYDSNNNMWIRIEYGDSFGWVAENNLTENTTE